MNWSGQKSERVAEKTRELTRDGSGATYYFCTFDMMIMILMMNDNE